MKGQHFNIKPKKEIVNGITFDSRLEASFYKKILPYNQHVNIQVHYFLSRYKWKVDFLLLAKDEIGFAVLDRFTGTGTGRLYVEIKGVFTKRFIDKYQRIIGDYIDKEIILLGNDYNALVYPVGSWQVRVKPVFPLRTFFSVFRETIDNIKKERHNSNTV